MGIRVYRVRQRFKKYTMCTSSPMVATEATSTSTDLAHPKRRSQCLEHTEEYEKYMREKKEANRNTGSQGFNGLGGEGGG